MQSFLHMQMGRVICKSLVTLQCFWSLRAFPSLLGKHDVVHKAMCHLAWPFSCSPPALFSHTVHTDLVPVPLPLSPECSSFSLRPGRQVGRPGWRQAFRSISTGPFVLARLSSQLIVTHRFVYWFSSFSPPLICNFYETQLYVFYNIFPEPCIFPFAIHITAIQYIWNRAINTLYHVYHALNRLWEREG